MKDDKVKESLETTVASAPSEPMKVEVVERITDADKLVLDMARSKKEMILEKAKTALAQSETAELAYNNIILQLALRYHLVDGDVIKEDGSIKRKE